MKLTPEYQAAVHGGYISREAAEKELLRTKDTAFDDPLQRRAFIAGFLWLNFLTDFSVTEKDLAEARAAWLKWCEHKGAV